MFTYLKWDYWSDSRRLPTDMKLRLSESNKSGWFLWTLFGLIASEGCPQFTTNDPNQQSCSYWLNQSKIWNSIHSNWFNSGFSTFKCWNIELVRNIDPARCTNLFFDVKFVFFRNTFQKLQLSPSCNSDVHGNVQGFEVNVSTFGGSSFSWWIMGGKATVFNWELGEILLDFANTNC